MTIRRGNMPDKFSVLMISPQFQPLVGGYERAAERLAIELASKGHTVTLVAERRNRQWPRTQTLKGVSVKRLWCAYRPGWHSITSFLSFLAFFLLYVRRFDVIHVHQYGHHAALAVALRRLSGKPVVLKLTSTAAQGIGAAIAGKRISTGLGAMLHRRVSALIATSTTALEEAVRFGIARNRIRLIPNGIETNHFFPSPSTEKVTLKSKLGLKKPLTVLYCGRLSPAKNPAGLISAWSAIHRDLPDCELVLIGDGPLRLDLDDQIIRLGLSASARLIGYQAEVLPWYQAADVFALPSHHEGLSNSLLEALSCGLPVVSTRVSGSTDVFAEADVGELVEVGDIPGIAKALHGLLKDSGRRAACGTNARQYARAKCSIHAVAEATEDLYRALCHVDVS